MKNSLKLTISAIAAAAVLGAGSANATVFSFDEFYIEKNGSEIFRDSFNDGVAPGSGPDDGILGAGNTYSVAGGGGILSENAGGNGRLLINSELGQLVTNPNGDARIRTRIRRNRSTNPTSSAYLGQGSDWTVNALLDLSTLPVNNGDAFGIRVEDFSGSNPNGGNDRLLLEVRRGTTSGNLGVWFGGLDFNGVGIETFDFFLLDPLLSGIPGLDQIALSLRHTVGANEVNGFFQLFSGGSLVLTQNLNNVGATSGLNAQIYSDEDFTRAAINTIQVAEIPEPGALALLLGGVAGIGFLRRRKNK